MSLNFFFGLIIIVSVSGCSEHLSFEELTDNNTIISNTKIYTSKEMNYKISLTSKLKLSETDYNDDMQYELYIDTMRAFEDGTNMISVLKYTASDTTLEAAWSKFVSNRIKIEGFQIYSQGLTNYLAEPAYYEHSTCIVSNRNVESISFLFHGSSSDFYVMSIQGITEEGYPNNMKELLYCAKSLKIVH